MGLESGALPCVQSAQAEAPVYHVRPVVPLLLQLLALSHTGVRCYGEVLQPVESGQPGHVPQLGQLVVGQAQLDQLAR